ncbi:MAG: ribonuclease HII [Opitutales bacterium]
MGNPEPRALKPATDRARRRLWEHDRRILKADTNWLIGVDEVGRGALAGPVVAAAVALGPEFLTLRSSARDRTLFADSKQLDPRTRQAAWERIRALEQQQMLAVALGSADVAEIDRHNILGATRLAMRRALECLAAAADGAWVLPQADGTDSPLFSRPERAGSPVRLLIDGRPLKPFPYRHEGMVRGDGRSLAIALASIAAKVSRDREMIQSEERFSGYGFSAHKGYGTPQHWQALEKHGPSPWHRRSFLKTLATGRDLPEKTGEWAFEPDA